MHDVLIVEDERDILQLLQFALKGPQYQVRACETGEAALEAIRARRPDLVLLDISLPGISGRDVCRSIRNDPATSSVPVIFLTARGGSDEIRRGLEAGADAYLLKPFDPAPLRATMERLLARKPPSS